MARHAVVLAALATMLFLAATATGDPGADKARIDSRIGDLQAQVERAARSEGVLTSELSGIAARVRAAESAVASEQAQLATLESALASERRRLAALEQKITVETARLAVLEREYAAALEVLERHLRAIYESDSPDLIAFALGTTSFSDLLDNLDLLNRIGRQDERIASTLNRARIDLEQTRATTEQARRSAARSEALISSRTTAQRATTERIVAERNALAAAQGEKAGALSAVREDRASFVAEAESLAAESAALAAQIAAAQRAAAAAPAPAPSAAAPASSGGQLGWPVAGPVTSGFGARWGRMHEGIDIAVGSGTPVYAAAAGTVIHAGWLGGYGNLVVIDHGNGLSTAYAHNSSFVVGPGASVGKGFVIALSGNTGNSSGPHVHFEVRVNGAPVDPLGYL